MSRYLRLWVGLFIMVTLVLTTPAIMGSEKKTGKTISVVDLEGRTVTLKDPVERVVLMESSKVHEFAAIHGEGFVDKIVGWDNDFKAYAGDGYEMFVKKYPKLAQIPDVGFMDQGTLSIEKVISLKPDVFIAHSWQFMWGGESTKDALAKLERAGIPVVFVDFYMHPMQNSTKSMLVLGKILGKEKRAQNIVDFYNNQSEIVYSRVKKITKSKPTVYIETGYKGPNTYGITEGDVGWGSIVKKAGGDNIAEPLLKNSSKAISPEFLITSNPEIIILTGRQWSTPGSVRMGYLSSPAKTKSTMDAYVNRPGWDTVRAEKEKKVFGIYHGFCFSIYNFIALQTFANWFYPEEFKDINPEATLRTYHEKFMPIDYAGTFIYSYYK